MTEELKQQLDKIKKPYEIKDGIIIIQNKNKLQDIGQKTIIKEIAQQNILLF